MGHTGSGFDRQRCIFTAKQRGAGRTALEVTLGEHAVRTRMEPGQVAGVPGPSRILLVQPRHWGSPERPRLFGAAWIEVAYRFTVYRD